MMGTTTAAIFLGPGSPIELREIPLPTLIGPEILVEVVACTLCGSDLHSIRGLRKVPVPTILGHEILGRIVEFGPTAPRHDSAGRALALGDRVTWSIVANCGECFYCRRDLPQKCERQTKYGHEPLRPGGELTGGLAGHCVLASGTSLYRVPESLSDASACPANCAGATVGAAIEAAGPLLGRRVLVMGSGMLGVTAAAWARAIGAERVIACDLDPARLDLASTFGATDPASFDRVSEVVLGATNGHGVDVAIELTGSPDSFETVLPLIRMGGRLILVGAVFPTRPVSLSPEQLVRRCLTLRGIHNYAPRHLHEALDFLASHPDLPFGDLVSGWESLSALPNALSEPLPPGKLRLGIRPRA
ncbi:zinc-binding dehydrogenase [Tundrisphaera lichenicola]|uniref:zinc-binding dehydrogenase n=1 Tax=Tundrisphaera lichenicola TaxID=2029860 RepID=UPI003EB72CE6